MKFSVIIPTLNSSKTILKSIYSVLNQTCFDPIIEILVVDNGSIDRTIQLVNEVSCNKIRILYCGTRGASHARNYGVANATCDWIAFLDSDDCWGPDKIKHQIALIRHSHATLIGSSTYKAFNESVYQFRPLDFLRGNFLVTSSIVFYRPVLRGEALFKIHVPFSEDFISWIYLSLLSQNNFIGPLNVLYSIAPKSNYSFVDIIASIFAVVFSTFRLPNLSLSTRIYLVIIFSLGSLRASPSILLRLFGNSPLS